MLQQLSYSLLKAGSRLLHQQCWMWGQDVRRPEGNLLLEYGFQRQRPPEGVCGSSQYTYPLDSSFCIRLWGFGLYYGNEVGIYLNRYSFVPRRALLKDCWQGEAMSGLPRETDLHLLPEILRWLASYEEWIKQHTSAQYQTQRRRNPKAGGEPHRDQPKTWIKLLEALEDGAAS